MGNVVSLKKWRAAQKAHGGDIFGTTRQVGAGKTTKTSAGVTRMRPVGDIAARLIEELKRR